MINFKEYGLEIDACSKTFAQFIEYGAESIQNGHYMSDSIQEKLDDISKSREMLENVYKLRKETLDQCLELRCETAKQLMKSRNTALNHNDSDRPTTTNSKARKQFENFGSLINAQESQEVSSDFIKDKNLEEGFLRKHQALIDDGFNVNNSKQAASKYQQQELPLVALEEDRKIVIALFDYTEKCTREVLLKKGQILHIFNSKSFNGRVEERDIPALVPASFLKKIKAFKMSSKDDSSTLKRQYYEGLIIKASDTSSPIDFKESFLNKSLETLKCSQKIYLHNELVLLSPVGQGNLIFTWYFSIKDKLFIEIVEIIKHSCNEYPNLRNYFNFESVFNANDKSYENIRKICFIFNQSVQKVGLYILTSLKRLIIFIFKSYYVIINPTSIKQS